MNIATPFVASSRLGWALQQHAPIIEESPDASGTHFATSR
jgi:hypothetical protein